MRNSGVLLGFFVNWDYFVFVCVGGLLALLARLRFVRRRGVVAYSVFLAVALAGAVVEYINVIRPPTHLEPVSVWLDGTPKPVFGYFIAGASGFVYLATAGESPCEVGVIRAFRQKDIAEIRLAPSINVWPKNKAPKRGAPQRRCQAAQKRSMRLVHVREPLWANRPASGRREGPSPP